MTSKPAQRPRVLTSTAGLLRASHLPPTVAVVALTTGLAALNGRAEIGCIAVAVAVLSGQLSTGWSNDWFDAERDRSVGRTDKPIAAGLVTVSTVRTASFLALVACVPLSLLSGWRATAVHLVAIGSAWAYNAGLKGTILSALPDGPSFAMLPAVVTLAPPTQAWPRPGLMAAACLLGVGAHFINTLADRDDDHATGVRGLPQRMPSTSVIIVGVGLLGGCAAAIWTLGGSSRSWSGLLFVGCLMTDLGVVGTAIAGRPRLAWILTLVSVVGCLGLFGALRPSLI